MQILRFIKHLIFTLTIAFSVSSWACEALFTGSVVLDKHRSGTVKSLKSVSSLTDTYGDNSPLYNLLISVDFLKNKKWQTQNISLETIIKSGKLELKKQSHSLLEPWSEDEKYLIAKDFDADKFKQKVNGFLEPYDSKLLATTIEIHILHKQKVVCTHKLKIDNH